MKKLRELTLEREALERKATDDTVKFVDPQFEVNKLPFSIRDTLL